MKILLASTSPYRKQLLERLKMPFECEAPNVDEVELKKEFKGAPDQLPIFLAEAKANSLLEKNPQGITIGCDQIALLDKEILNKPGSEEAARKQLTKLSGHKHHLITAIAVHGQGIWLHETNITSLRMKKLTEKQIDTYVRKEQPINCAGAYKIEGLGISLFEDIKTDDFTAIIGLPLLALCRIFEKLNYPPLKPQ